MHIPPRSRHACPVLLLLSVALAGSVPTHAQGAGIFLDPAQPIQVRVNDLIQHMTLEEKVTQMHNRAAAIPRLSVPAYDWWSEALHGIARSGYATLFPQAIGLAATWDTPLMHQVATVISTETRAKNAEALRHDNHGIYFGLDLWSPNINIFRDPRWGRGQETYGEDPFLTARLGVAFITGLQGDDPRYLRAGSALALDAEVENTGDRIGDAVSEVYLTPPASPSAPAHMLAGLTRTTLKPHQMQRVHLVIDPRSLSTVAADGTRAIQPGTYSIFVGAAQPGNDTSGLSHTFTISGTQPISR